MSKKYKSVLILMIAAMMLQIGSLSARADRHFQFTLKPTKIPMPCDPDIMVINGFLTVDQQIRTGDELGALYQNTVCGSEIVLNSDGSFILYVFNYNAVLNGPHPGDVVEIRLWDNQKQVELSTGFQVTILDPEIKNSAGRLIWKLNNCDTPWRVNISYDTQLLVSRVEPGESYIDRSQQIIITGNNFAAGAEVTIGSKKLTQVSFINATTLQAIVPAGFLPVGTYNLTVSAGGKSGTLPNGYKVLATPVSVTRVDPNENPVDQTKQIIITGAGFVDGAKVKIGAFELPQVTFMSATTLQATVPAQFLSEGTYDVTVIAGSLSAILPFGFRVLPSATPRITAVSPNQGSNDQSIPIWIIGSNLFEGSQVKISNASLDMSVNVTGYSGEVIIFATIPAGIASGTYKVTVVSPTGAAGWIDNGYKVLAAPISVTQVSPATGYSNQSQKITITGNNFSLAAKVKLGATELSEVSFINGTTLEAMVPANFPVGTYDVVVVAGETSGNLPNGFTVQQGHEETVSLVSGLNLMAYPVPVPEYSSAVPYSSYDFLNQYFTPQSLDSLWHYNNQSSLWEVTSWGSNGFPSGDVFTMKNGEGYLVYAKMKKDLAFPGEKALFETNLYQGMNLVSFSPPNESFTSYDLIQGMANGQASVVALQRYEKNSGRWYSTFCQSGKATGDNFPIYNNESYLVYMKKPFAWMP